MSQIPLRLKLTPWTRFLVVALALLPLSSWAGNPVVPTPKLYTPVEGSIALSDETVIAVDGADSALEQVRWVAGLVQSHTGLNLRVVAGQSGRIRVAAPDPAGIVEWFEQAGLPAPHLPSEAYRIAIDDAGVEILSGGEAGRLYGLVTLWQWLAAAGDGEHRLPKAQILDAPAFAWRGLMLDSARHMQSVEFIKGFLDWMALHKLNTLHWHLTDDQGWRLEIKAFPRLAEVGGFRVPAGDAPAADIDPATGQPRLYGGYYTQEQVRDIVAYAGQRQIMVVPEIDVPGHVTAAIVAYPELGIPGFLPDRVSADWGIFDNVLNLEESTFEFMETVLAEVVALFPAPYIHLGGDEVSTAQWEASERVAERMAELGIDSMQGVQNHFIERLQAWLDQHGRRVIGWDEVLESNLPEHAVVMSWRGAEGAVEAAEKGHQAILSPAPTLYFDHLQTAAPDAPPGRGGVITVRDVYEIEMLPESLSENRHLLMGVQANLWTEHIRTEERAAYMAWPRAAAVAELGWVEPSVRDWDGFAERLPAALARLEKLGVPAARDDHTLYGLEPVPMDAMQREDREMELCSNAIVLALEDDAPLLGERESFQLDIMNPCWIWRGANLSGIEAISARVGQLPFNFRIGDMIDDVVVETPESGAGELLVRLNACEGPVIARLPLAPAVGRHGATELAPAPLTRDDPLPEKADLCFSFSRRGVEPIWAVDWVRLEGGRP